MNAGGPVLILYAAQPDLIVLDWLRANLDASGLSAHGLEVNLVTGHPVWPSGSNSKSVDRAYPRVGVAHAADSTITEAGVGGGFEELYPDDEFRELLHAYARIPEVHRAPDAVIEALLAAPVVQRWVQLVESLVVVAGFCGGGAAWMDNRRLYLALDGLLHPMQHDLQAAHPGVKFLIAGPREVDLEYNEEPHGKLFGFEIALRVRQPRRIFRALKKYERPRVDRFDIHLRDSATVWGTPGKFDFGAGP